MLREVPPHTGLQSTVKSFHDARFCLLVVRDDVLDIVRLQMFSKGPIEELRTYVCDAVGVVSSVSKLSKAVTNVAPNLFFNGTHHVRFEKSR